MPPIAADNKHIQISLDTHIVAIISYTKAPVAERFLCPYIDGLQLADSNFRAKEHQKTFRSLVISFRVGVHALPLNSALG